MKENQRLKPQYVMRDDQGFPYFRLMFGSYVSRKNTYFRVFSCRQELSKAVMHSIEYGPKGIYKVKIRAKRSNGLPNPWDDYFAEDLTYKSWKDRTKRKKQYYRENQNE